MERKKVRALIKIDGRIEVLLAMLEHAEDVLSEVYCELGEIIKDINDILHNGDDDES